MCWSVVVPFQVMANGAFSPQPLAISILPRSTGPVSAPRMTSVPSVTDTRLTSPGVMMRTSLLASVVSANAGVLGTAVAVDTPGTTSNGTRALAQAAASAAALAEHERVAAEQADRQLAGLGRLDQQLRVGELGV